MQIGIAVVERRIAVWAGNVCSLICNLVLVDRVSVSIRRHVWNSCFSVLWNQVAHWQRVSFVKSRPGSAGDKA